MGEDISKRVNIEKATRAAEKGDSWGVEHVLDRLSLTDIQQAMQAMVSQNQKDRAADPTVPELVIQGDGQNAELDRKYDSQRAWYDPARWFSGDVAHNVEKEYSPPDSSSFGGQLRESISSAVSFLNGDSWTYQINKALEQH